ncbi:hypothetical protein B0H13DRAFT_1604019, partial [Mycena leptocephala]
LPASVKGVFRRDLIRAYQECKGGNYEVEGLHEAVRWRSHEDEPLLPTKIPTGKWELVGSDKPKKKITTTSELDSSGRKRKTSEKTAGHYLARRDAHLGVTQ